MKTKIPILISFLLFLLLAFSHSTSAATVTKTLYSWAKDATGNISTSLSDSIDITLPEEPTNTYYVSYSTGLDTNNGTSSSTPWKTIAKVNSQTFTPGDSILFNRGDSWRESLKFMYMNGTATDRITIGAYGSGNKPKLYGSIDGDISGYWTNLGGNRWATPVGSFSGEVNMLFYNTNTTQSYGKKETIETDLNVDWEFWYDTTNDRVLVYQSSGSPNTQANGLEITGVFNTNPSGTVIYLQFADYWTVQDLDIRYSNNSYISTDGDYIIVSRVEGYYGYDKGIDLYGDYEIIEDSYLYDTGYRALINNAGGESIWLQSQTGSIVRNNEIELSHAIGINVFGVDNMTIENNYVHGIEYYPPDGSGNSGIYLDGSSNSIVRNNIVEGFINGFAVNAERDDLGMICHDITFSNNVAINNTEVSFGAGNNSNSGARRDNAVYNINFYNNVSYSNITEMPFKVEQKVRNVNIKNNIIYSYNNGASIFVGSYTTEPTIVVDYNDYYWLVAPTFVWNNVWLNSYSTYKTTSGQDSHSVITDPLFLSSTDLHLQSNSPAINAGINVGLPYNGSAPDIGAFETNY